MRAKEIQAEVILKGTKVDGVYDKDPMKESDATRFETLAFIDALKQNLRVMDATAISLCMEEKIPIRVFDINVEGNIRKVVAGEAVGTLVSNGETLVAIDG